MTTGTFGENLKREREMRGVTLDEITAGTRIAKRFLQAIENEQWDKLPGGVFNRGFVRATARYLGLDEEKIVAEYVLAVGDRPSVPVWTGSPPVVTPEQPWLAWIIGAVVVLVLLAGGWFGVRRLLQRRAVMRAEQEAALSATASPGPPEGSQATSGDAVPANNVPTEPVSTTAPSGGPTGIAVPATAAPPPSPATDQIELKIETDKRTKVIVVADKDVVYDGTMKAGENHFFSAADHFQVSAKDAGVVHLALNGKTLSPMGNAGQAAKVTLTRDSLKGSPGGGT
jgi:cytoskeleton protein RodZ